MAMVRDRMLVFSANRENRTLFVSVKRNPEPKDIISVAVPPDDQLRVPFAKLAKTGAIVEIEAEVENGKASRPRLSESHLVTRLGVAESASVEFKRSLFVSADEKKNQMEVVAQTIASFMNGEGGDIYFGVSDDGSVHYGLAEDYRRLAAGAPETVVATSRFKDEGRTYKGDADGFASKLHAVVRGYLGPAAEAYLGDCEEMKAQGNKPYVKLTVKPAPDDVIVYYPIMLERGTIDAIFVRNGAAKKNLMGSDRDQFVRERTKRVVLSGVNLVMKQNLAQQDFSELIDKIRTAITEAATSRAPSVGPSVQAGSALAFTEAAIANTDNLGVLYYRIGTPETKSDRIAKTTYGELYVALLKILSKLDEAKFKALPDEAEFAPKRKSAATSPNFARRAVGRGAGVRMKNAETIGDVRANLQGLSKAAFFDPKKLPMRLLAHFGISWSDFSVGK